MSGGWENRRGGVGDGEGKFNCAAGVRGVSMVTVEGWKEMGEPVCTEVEYCEWTLNNKHQIFSFRASFLFLWGG